MKLNRPSDYWTKKQILIKSNNSLHLQSGMYEVKTDRH